MLEAYNDVLAFHRAVDNPIEAYQEDGGDNQIVLNRLLGKSRGKTLVKQKFKGNF